MRSAMPGIFKIIFMKVKIGNTIYDSNVEPIAIVFDTDAERIATGNHISMMQPRTGIRVYLQYPYAMSKKDAESFVDSIPDVPGNDPGNK